MPFLSARQQGDPGSAQKPTGKGAEHSDASNNIFLARNAESPAPQEDPVEEATPTATSPSKKGKRGAQAKTTSVAEEQGQQAPAVASEPPARRQSARNAAAAATTQSTRTEQEAEPVSPKKTRAAAANKPKEPATMTPPATRKQKSAAQAKVAQDLTDAQPAEATLEDGMEPVESLLYNQDLTEAFVADDTQPKANPADDGRDTIQPPLAQLAKQLRKSKAGGKRKRKGGRNTVAADAASASDESEGHAVDPDAVFDADEGADEDEEQETEKPAKTPRQRGPAKPRVDADGFPLKRAKRTQNGKELRQIARKGFGKQRPLVKQDGTPAVVGTPKHKKIEATCFECREAQTSNFRPIVSDYVGKKSKATEKITRVEVCNRCYCKMAPRPDYLPWRLNLLRLQIEIFGQAGITQFHCFRFSDDGIKTLAEALEYVDFVRDSLAGGNIVGGLKVKPVLPGQVTPMRRPSPDMRPMQLQPLQPMPQMQQMQPMHQMQQMQPMQSYSVHDGLQAMRGGAHMPQLIHQQGPGETESEIALRQLNQHTHVPVPIPEPILEM